MRWDLSGLDRGVWWAERGIEREGEDRKRERGRKIEEREEREQERETAGQKDISKAYVYT